jgi:hypothetical protein
MDPTGEPYNSNCPDGSARKRNGLDMPIPLSSVTHIEIGMFGTVAAGGSNAKASVATFQYRRTATVLTISKAAVETAFQAAICVPLTNALNARYAQTFNTVRYLDDATDFPSQVTRAVAGQIAGECLTTAESLFLLLRTGLRGKSYRGAKKLFPFSESDTTLATADLWNAGALARFATLAAAILAGFTDATGNVWVPQVVSKKLSQLTANPTTVVGNDVTSVLINKRVGTMRHRKVKSVY